MQMALFPVPVRCGATTSGVREDTSNSLAHERGMGVSSWMCHVFMGLGGVTDQVISGHGT